MTQTWIILSIALGVLLISDTSADPVADQWRKTQERRLAEVDRQHENFVKNLTAHGLDYFAGMIETHYDPKPLYKTFPKEPQSSRHWLGMLERLEVALASPFRKDFPWLELYKGTALYRNAIVSITGQIDPVGQAMKGRVLEMITLEQTYDHFTAEQKANDKVVWKQIEETRSWLSANIDSVPAVKDFYQLESLVNEDIRRLHAVMGPQSAAKRQHQLNEFLSTNVQLNRMYPLDSHLRANQFSALAHQHYRQYVQLKNVLGTDHM